MNKFINCLKKKENSCFPIWFMRQAGRYLPEFRKIRSKNPNFINLCLDSDLSSEITLQPVKRFNLDAAIIFSDILMVPYALGQEVKFIKNHGPKLSKFNVEKFLVKKKKNFEKALSPVYEAISKTKKKLNKKKSLISFVGAPWTLLIYMLNIKDDNNNINQQVLKNKKKEIKVILEGLNDFLKIHIKNQINAGSDVVQIFDSWASLIPPSNMMQYCYKPNLQIVKFCKSKKIPTICFPKGIKNNYSKFLDIVQPDGLSLDYDLDPLWASKNLNNVCLQGGMDPKIMLLDDKKIKEEAEKYLKIFKNLPYIFNLGHGLLPETEPEKVKKLVNFVKNYE